MLLLKVLPPCIRTNYKKKEIFCNIQMHDIVLKLDFVSVRSCPKKFVNKLRSEVKKCNFNVRYKMTKRIVH